ncbi:MAG: ribonuclease P protein component [Candidatus Omnitrophica bacterium]|nr:ribonuclease P protein component [Candidatus Omnitrophota bacterium]
MKRFAFTKAERLRQTKAIRHVFANGKKARAQTLRLYFLPNQLGVTRCAVVVPLKATCRSIILRNRVKRLLKEAFRLTKALIADNIDIIIFFSPKNALDKQTLKGLHLSGIRTEYVTLCRRAGIMRHEKSINRDS